MGPRSAVLGVAVACGTPAGAFGGVPYGATKRSAGRGGRMWCPPLARKEPVSCPHLYSSLALLPALSAQVLEETRALVAQEDNILVIPSFLYLRIRGSAPLYCNPTR
eukprot:8533224-Pyramimonas_sp.AAC.1